MLCSLFGIWCAAAVYVAPDQKFDCTAVEKQSDGYWHIKKRVTIAAEGSSAEMGPGSQINDGAVWLGSVSVSDYFKNQCEAAK